MRILIVDGPGTHPRAYAATLSRTLERAGHTPFLESLSAGARPRRVRRRAKDLVARTAPDIIHVVTSIPGIAEAFAGRDVPVVHSTLDRPSRTDWIVVPSRVALNRVAGGGQGLDYRVGRLPYAMPITETAIDAVGSFALARLNPRDDRAARWLEDLAWRTSYVPVKTVGDPRLARFVIYLSSTGESWPAGVAEAMAAGRAVVATWGGAAPEFAVEGLTGFLSAPGDGDALAAHVTYLWDHPEEALRMGRAAREEAKEHFGAEAHARQLIRCYVRAGASRLAV
jgi:hypothetical protein